MTDNAEGGIATGNDGAQNRAIGLDKVRSGLAWIWLTGSGSIFLILAVQSLLGKYQEDVQEVWGWALPTILPTLGMIITVLGYTALNPNQSRVEVRKDFYRVSKVLSVVYIGLVLLTIFLQPFAPYEPVRLMRMANLWLGPCQGLVASALGVLFFSKRPRRR